MMNASDDFEFEKHDEPGSLNELVRMKIEQLRKDSEVRSIESLQDRILHTFDDLLANKLNSDDIRCFMVKDGENLDQKYPGSSLNMAMSTLLLSSKHQVLRETIKGVKRIYINCATGSSPVKFSNGSLHFYKNGLDWSNPKSRTRSSSRVIGQSIIAPVFGKRVYESLSEILVNEYKFLCGWNHSAHLRLLSPGINNLSGANLSSTDSRDLKHFEEMCEKRF